MQRQTPAQNAVLAKAREIEYEKDLPRGRALSLVERLHPELWRAAMEERKAQDLSRRPAPEPPAQEGSAAPGAEQNLQAVTRELAAQKGITFSEALRLVERTQPDVYRAGLIDRARRLGELPADPGSRNASLQVYDMREGRPVPFKIAGLDASITATRRLIDAAMSIADQRRISFEAALRAIASEQPTIYLEGMTSVRTA